MRLASGISAGGSSVAHARRIGELFGSDIFHMCRGWIYTILASKLIYILYGIFYLVLGQDILYIKEQTSLNKITV